MVFLAEIMSRQERTISIVPNAGIRIWSEGLAMFSWLPVSTLAAWMRSSAWAQWNRSSGDAESSAATFASPPLPFAHLISVPLMRGQPKTSDLDYHEGPGRTQATRLPFSEPHNARRHRETAPKNRRE